MFQRRLKVHGSSVQSFIRRAELPGRQPRRIFAGPVFFAVSQRMSTEPSGRFSACTHSVPSMTRALESSRSFLSPRSRIFRLRVAFETRLRPLERGPFGGVLRAPVGKIIDRDLHVVRVGIPRGSAAGGHPRQDGEEGQDKRKCFHGARNSAAYSGTSSADLIAAGSLALATGLNVMPSKSTLLAS